MHELEIETILRLSPPIASDPSTGVYDIDKTKYLECDVIHKTITMVQGILKNHSDYKLKITDDIHRREFIFTVGKWSWIIKLTDVKSSKYAKYFRTFEERFDLENKINNNLPLL